MQVECAEHRRVRLLDLKLLAAVSRFTAPLGKYNGAIESDFLSSAFLFFTKQVTKLMERSSSHSVWPLSMASAIVASTPQLY